MTGERGHTWASRAVVVTTGLLGLLQLGWAARASDGGLIAAVASLGVVTLLVMVRMARGNSFEARLAAVLLGSCQLAVALLTITIGLPGQEPERADPLVLATLVVATALLALVVGDARLAQRRVGHERDRPDYAL